MTKFTLALIRSYKAIRQLGIGVLASLVPDTGCRFTPTCSAYSHQAYSRFGFLKGSALTLKRLFRCHPWGGSGHDPIPPKSPTP